MTRDELRDRLAHLGVRADAYDLDGQSSDEVYVLAREGEDEAWIVFYRERGERGDERRHATEALACADLLDRVERDPTTRGASA